MEKLNDFCTCTSTDCPNHPKNNDKGCTPCIIKNLKKREIPSCFFVMAAGTDKRNGFSFEDFAKAVLNEQST